MAEHMITIFLHGPLRKLWPEPYRLMAATAAEAIQAFCKMTKVLNPTPGQGRHLLRVSGCETAESLFMPFEMDELHLYPDFRGGGGGGFLKIILGAVAIAAAFIPGVGPAVSAALISLGASFVLGGLLEFISPAPKSDTNSNSNESSKYLGAPGNTTKIGTRIPLAYGLRRLYGQYLSYDIVARDVNPQTGANIAENSVLYVTGNSYTVTT